MKTLFPLILAASLESSALPIFDEKDGLVIMEIEETDSPLDLWQLKTELAGYTGAGYLEFTGNGYELGPVKSPLEFHFRINQGGVYLLDLHCAKKTVDGRTDWANDCYVRVVGEFTSAPGPHDIPGGNASLKMLKTDMKFFGGAPDAWEWATGDWGQTGGRLDPGGKMNKRKTIYHFESGKTYTLVVSGRSKEFRVDRLMFREASAPKETAQDLSRPPSATFEGSPPIPDSLDVAVKASDLSGESHPDEDGVVHNARTHLANLSDGSWARFGDFDFGAGAAGSILVQASSEGKGGSIEVRTDSATGPLLGTVAIRKTWTMNDYESFGANLTQVSGIKDLYLVFKGEGENPFQVKEFTIQSGVTLEEKLPLPPVRPPAGRLAILADGNSPDPDDIGATAAALALLRATGLADRLVYCAHSCDLVPGDRISKAAELSRQEMMQTSCQGTAALWGGFEGLTFLNCRTEQEAAVKQLQEQINLSSATDPLWIVEAGEPDIIGYALEGAEPSKLPHVKILTHHSVNDSSGDFFKWEQILTMGAEIVRIPDQNGDSISQGLQRPLWAFHWARDHEDPRLKWLWEQGKIAEQDPVVGFQKNKIDLSDTGLVLYWITGANVNNGYRVGDMHDVRALLDRELSQSHTH